MNNTLQFGHHVVQRSTAVTPWKYLFVGWLSLITISASPAGEIYRWKDANGRVHFGDRPSTQAEVVEIRPTQTAPEAGPDLETARRERTQRLLNEYATERSEREEARAQAVAELAERRRRCADARREKVEIENSAYLYTRDDQGNKQILPDSELRKERARLQALVDELCKRSAGGPAPYR